MNAKHFGIFIFEVSVTRWVESIYDLNMILANLSVGALLLRWMVAKVAMLNSYRSGTMELQSVGIGVLSCARGFYWLSILFLPRLKMNLTVLATIGGAFEGAQATLTQAWFLVYPGIAEFMFFVYSLLNLIAKLLHRRMNDVLFEPTLIFLCVMHCFRSELAQSGWFEYDGRIPTVVTSEQFDSLSILDFFRNDALLKLSGNVKSLFLIKIGVLSLNFVPLIFSKRTDHGREAPTATEESLALHLVFSGGLRSAQSYKPLTSTKSLQLGNRKRIPVQPSFELLRMGYLVLGELWLISMHDWYLFVILAPVLKWRAPSIRVMVFAVQRDITHKRYFVDKKSIIYQISDPRILKCRPWDISAQPFR